MDFQLLSSIFLLEKPGEFPDLQTLITALFMYLYPRSQILTSKNRNLLMSDLWQYTQYCSRVTCLCLTASGVLPEGVCCCIPQGLVLSQKVDLGARAFIFQKEQKQLISQDILESYRFQDEKDYKYMIFSQNNSEHTNQLIIDT